MSYINSEGKKVAVIGGRNFKDKDRVFKILDKNCARIKYIVSGGAEGADSFADEWAKERGFPILTFYPRWKDPETGAHRKGAGFERNWEIVRNADVVLAFHDGVSRGTANSIDIAKQLNKPCKVYLFVPEPEKIQGLNLDVVEGQAPPEEVIKPAEITPINPPVIETETTPDIVPVPTLDSDYDPETV